jgi:hypothetical protein
MPVIIEGKSATFRLKPKELMAQIMRNILGFGSSQRTMWMSRLIY